VEVRGCRWVGWKWRRRSGREEAWEIQTEQEGERAYLVEFDVAG
jgi:hypothetical protein